MTGRIYVSPSFFSPPHSSLPFSLKNNNNGKPFDCLACATLKRNSRFVVFTTAITSMEAQFLQSQQARLALLKEQREKARQRQDDDGSIIASTATATVEVEAALQRHWKDEWQKRLAAMKQRMQEELPPQLEDDKRATLLALKEMQEILQAQRQRVVSSLSSSLTSSFDDTSLQRHWHKVLVEAQATLDTIQAKLLPKGKFVFYRYRQALANRQEYQQQHSSSSLSNKRQQGVCDDAKEETTSSMFDELDCLQDWHDKSIRIDENGMQCRSLSGSVDDPTTTLTDDDDTRQIEMASGSTVPLVWRRLKKCTVSWSSSPTNCTVAGGDSSREAAAAATRGAVLHLVDLQDCTLHIRVPLSSIHMTACRDVTLHVSQAQQVRLHKSHNIKVWGQVTAGTILERCTKIGVTTNCPNVQDFGWLKVGRPSPNLERLTEEEVPASPAVINAPVVGTSVVAWDEQPLSRPQNTLTLSTKAAVGADVTDNEDGNEEDEL